MTSNDGAAGEPRAISKADYGCLVAVVVVLLFITELIATAAVGRALGRRIEGSWIGGLAVLNLFLAKVVVDGILKGLGRSRSGKSLEVRGRTVALPEGEVSDDEVVEVRYPSSLLTGFGVACLSLCLVTALVLVAVPTDQMKGVV
jgi:hypothetical protein